ncbi:hypothetical protein EJ02DRAFT_453063 [Clathrospora elynae]|uniref:Uncharacterized protein n=1 Tax=Clathrospora elynae TaxID=706981 RepID=A0A6A5STJ1_9PLEO|nr:hypothetical protein EJ02DRAFT_453063 [Clathrospora elynae]
MHNILRVGGGDALDLALTYTCRKVHDELTQTAMDTNTITFLTECNAASSQAADLESEVNWGPPGQQSISTPLCEL